MMAVGYFLRSRDFIDDKTTHKLSKLFLTIFYPCMILSFFTQNFTFQSILNEAILPISVFLMMLVGLFIGILVVKSLKFNTKNEKDIFLFQCLINNYSFLPLPILLLFFGEAMATKLLFSTLGAEIAIWSIGVFCLTGEKLNKNFLKNIFSPPIIAIILSIFFLFIKQFFSSFNDSILVREIGASLFFVIDIFGRATLPIAMIVAGSRIFGISLKFKNLFDFNQICLVFVRLFLIPFFVFLILKIFKLQLDIDKKIIISIVSIMPCAVTSVVLSDIFGSDTRFAAKSVLTTHLVSLITIPAWFYFFNFNI